MTKKINLFIGLLGLSTLMLSPLAPTTAFTGADMALAGNGNGGGNGGGGNGGGNGGGKSGGQDKAGSNGAGNAQGKANAEKSQKTHSTTTAAKTTGAASKGMLASELKGLNAVRANPNALANASPNSQVGRIAAYRDAMLEAHAIEGDLITAQENLAALEDGYSGRSTVEIDADIAALDPAAADFAAAQEALDAERALAAAYEDEKTTLEKAVEDAALVAQDTQLATDDAISAMTGGRTLSPEAMDYINQTLGL